MKVTKIIFCFLISIIVFLISSCERKENIPVEMIENLGGYKPEGNPLIDEWIVNNLTKPFNVMVKYQYDPFEVDYTRNTVPPKEEFVIPVMNLVIDAMTTPFLTVRDSLFLHQIMPKSWVLIGSGQYNNDGTVVLGTAEGANKITVMDINKYSKTELFVRNIAYTVHHETAHIMHQTKMYTPSFKQVNPSEYTSTWFNVSDDDAKKDGFVRNYALASPDEDFVETIAFLLVHGQNKYDELINNANAKGKERLRIKQQFILEYFQEKWNIDFADLQEEVEKGIQNYLTK